MDLTMRAFDPTGHSHVIHGVDVPLMNVLLDRVKGEDDYKINVHDVQDRDGGRRRVIAVLWRGIIFDTFDFRR